MKKKDDHQEERSDSEMRPEGGSSPSSDKSDDAFVLPDGRFAGDGGAPGVDPDDWASIKHLVRGAGS
jgi:hypothetical protein